MLGITGFFAVMTPVTLGNDTWVVLVSQATSRWREQMTFMSFHSGGALPPQRHARSSTCPPQHRPQWAGHGHQEWCPASSARNARGWGATGRGWGVLRVGGAFVQYAQPLASGSRPSWSRPTRVISSQFWAGPESNHDHRDPAQMVGRSRWGRTCDGGAGLCRKNPGLTPARP